MTYQRKFVLTCYVVIALCIADVVILVSLT
jgi:hypothetical protein